MLMTVGSVSMAVHAAPKDDQAICGRGPAIVTTWQCGSEDSTGYCTLWGVDVSGSGRWGEQSIFVIEGPESVDRVGYDVACKDGRCARPWYSVCSTPVTHSRPTRLEALLRP